MVLFARFNTVYSRRRDSLPFRPVNKTFRKVRKLRQKPAHAINENEFNQKYFTQQRKLVIEAYKAIRALRLILANHPRVINYKGVPEWLYKGEISTF